MRLDALSGEVVALGPHVAAVALCAGRILPVTLLCPAFGGVLAPTTPRLALTLTLAIGVHGAGGVDAPGFDGAGGLAVLAVKELSLGLVIGLVASLPFDAARMGGRLIDLLRGSSAEAALPMAGSRETAGGDLLYQLLVAVVATGAGLPFLLAALWRTFGAVPLGAHLATESVALQIASVVGIAFAAGLAIGAPVAGACLAVDATVALVGRAVPQLQLQELGTPIRLVVGAAVLWAGVGLVCDRLMGRVAEVGPDLLSVIGRVG